MNVWVKLSFSADGYETEAEELDCLRTMLEDLDSAAVTVTVISVEKAENVE